MTLQNLSKILDKYEEQFGSTYTQQFGVLKGLPFYSDWIRQINPAKTDFNHAIGLPPKEWKELAITLIDRMKYLFRQKIDLRKSIFDTKEKS